MAIQPAILVAGYRGPGFGASWARQLAALRQSLEYSSRGIITQVDQAWIADEKAWKAIVLGTDPTPAETLLARISTYRQFLYLRPAEGPLRLEHSRIKVPLWSKYPRSCENRTGFSFISRTDIEARKGLPPVAIFPKAGQDKVPLSCENLHASTHTL